VLSFPLATFDHALCFVFKYTFKDATKRAGVTLVKNVGFRKVSGEKPGLPEN
jgi:hypothetical protein